MTAILEHGEFFGMREQRREIAGFSVSVAAADPRCPVQRHTHEDAHFVLLIDGHYLSSARGAGHLHAEPALIYNPPGTTHQDTFPECEGRFAGISISAARMAELAEVAAPGEAAIRVWSPSALAAAQRLARGVAHGGGALALEALCLELVGGFLDDEATRPPRWLRRVREVLHDRACEALTMASIAADAGVHPVYLARAFRRFFGCTPAEYVRQCRVERAAVLVRAGRLALAEIALACGFVDQSHFTRAFARTFAASPGAYRARHRAAPVREVARVQDGGRRRMA